MLLKIKLSTVTALIFAGALFTLVRGSTIRIGVVMDGPNERNTQIIQQFSQEINKLTNDQHTVLIPSEKIITDTWHPERIKQHYQSLITDREVDIVCALGAISSTIALQQEHYAKPVIAPFILDHALQNAPYAEGNSGVHNLCYLSMPQSIHQDLSFFKEVTDFNHCAILVNKTYADVVPDLSEYLSDIAQQLSCSIECIHVGASADSALWVLSDNVDAVYLANLDQFTESEFALLVSGLKKQRIPSFSPLGASYVEKGVMISRHPDPLPLIARKMAVAVQKILMGEDPGEFNVLLAINEQLSFNIQTAYGIGFEPPWHIFNEANIFGTVPDSSPQTLSLKSVVEQAVEKNLSYRAENHKAVSARYVALAAQSNLMPKLELGAQGYAIEEEMARVSMGNPPQYSATASASLTQVLYSDQLFSGIAIAQHAREAQIYRYRQSKLDLAADVASAYYDVLQAIALEKIMRKTMEQSRNYLQLAHIRIAVGTADRSEGYRWESRIAMNLKDLIETNAARNNAEIALNRLLDQPHEQRIIIVENVEDPLILISLWKHYNDCFNSKSTFRAFRNFMVAEAIANSPELKAVDEGIAIHRRKLTSARRAWWQPTIAAQARAEGIIAKDGTGADVTPVLPPGMQQPDDINLTLGVSLSLPVYSGAALYANVKQQKEIVRQKDLEKEAVIRSIEQRIRSSLHLCGSAYAGLEQAQKAASAASNAREIVEAAYAQGSVSFTALSDAQTQEQIAKAASAQAVFSYLKMLIQVQRAAGQFDLFRTGEEMTDFTTRLKNSLVSGKYN